MTNDNDFTATGTMPRIPDVQGQAAITLVECLIHGLVEQSVLTLSQAVEIIDSAIEVQTDVADAADDNAETMWRSHAILVGMSASLKRDVEALDD